MFVQARARVDALEGAPQPPAVDDQPSDTPSDDMDLAAAANAALESAAAPDRALDRAADAALEPRYMILVHNDDVTPYQYVLTILGRVFLLSDEIAEHVASTAHSDGQAVVMIRPREECKRLIAVAHARARMDGYPLAFTMEPEP